MGSAFRCVLYRSNYGASGCGDILHSGFVLYLFIGRPKARFAVRLVGIFSGIAWAQGRMFQNCSLCMCGLKGGKRDDGMFSDVNKIGSIKATLPIDTA